eukprot:TRINITY_DN9600_c0_g1_i3.p1 TRINITY_DN9600_c0_g1~~TRINITY_DN9600_c0_g1_i3.p1  ORF type:complete len:224 (-),score=34.83 TRINITY_DN9600_c0_g1_i3:1216-1887(-)
MSLIEQFVSLTGVNSAVAASYLEMGGSLDNAITLFFDGAEPTFQTVQLHTKPSWYTVIWPEKAAIHPSWLEQGFEFSSKEGERLGLLQSKNGPCGLLCAVNALLLVQCLEDPGFGLNYVPSDFLLAKTLGTILLKVRTPGQQKCTVVKWKGVVGEDLEFLDIPTEEIFLFLERDILIFKSRGGAVLFLYSVVFTRGIDQVSIPTCFLLPRPKPKLLSFFSKYF